MRTEECIRMGHVSGKHRILDVRQEQRNEVGRPHRALCPKGRKSSVDKTQQSCRLWIRLFFHVYAYV